MFSCCYTRSYPLVKNLPPLAQTYHYQLPITSICPPTQTTQSKTNPGVVNFPKACQLSADVTAEKQKSKKIATTSTKKKNKHIAQVARAKEEIRIAQKDVGQSLW